MIVRLDIKVDDQPTTILAWLDAADLSYVGTVELLCRTPHRPGSLTGEPRRAACIRQLFVKNGMRRNGIGTELVGECVKIARAYGCESLGLSLAKDNTVGEAFYRSLGFIFAYQYDDGSFLVVKNLREVA